MFCKHCGTKLKPDAKFCEACGKPRDVEDGHKNTSPISDTEKKLNSSDNEVSALGSDSGHTDAVEKPFSPKAVIMTVIGIIIAGAIVWSAISSSSNSPKGSSTIVSTTDNGVLATVTTTSSVSTSVPSVTSRHSSEPINRTLQSTPASPNSNSGITPSFINEIEPAIVLVACFPPDYSTSGEFDYGSGVSVDRDGANYIETNYHVYNGANTGGGSPSCVAYYPGPAPDFAINDQSAGYQLDLSNYNYDPDTSEDVADFTLGASVSSSVPLATIPVINGTGLTGIGSGCSNVNNGDSVTIFGYPASGNYLNVSETVTQGTISGQTPGPIYKFDGAIDHGNSGGLAVLDKNSCDLGIPTLGVSGLTAGTGYIQSISLSQQPVTLSDDQICQNDYGTNSDYTGNNSQGGISCGCDSGYEWNTGDTACVAVPPESGYQVCSETYPNETWDGTYNGSGQYDCVCDSGYSMYNNQCVSNYDYCTDTEGYGANYDPSTNSCGCDVGYMYSNGQCEEGDVYCSDTYGSGAEFDYSTNGCECGYGYESNGSQCVYAGY